MLLDRLLCTKCRLVRPLDEFAVAPGRPRPARANRHSWCKACQRAAVNRRNAERRALGLSKDLELRRKFGITLDEWNALLAAQGGGCAVCGAAAGDSSGRSLHTDHCHTTGRVRGLLCKDCNNALGLAADDPARLRALADYLERDRG